MNKDITSQIEIASDIIQNLEQDIKNVEDFCSLLSKSLTQNTTKMVEIILSAAVILSASDIHFEPQKEKVRLRLRIDGLLTDIFFFEPFFYKTILSRIKLVSGTMLNISNRAQDGRFTILYAGQPIEVRVSCLPSEYGEALVMRVLNPKNILTTQDLGIRQDMMEVFEKEIRQPNGMILVTGPTGSGKTTTLYAILKKIYNPAVKIITIEDPIEYHLSGISQTQVNPEAGYDFASGLQAIVRQDPDVILVGEIRDFATAQIALQAALTGHLVLSTLHTNDASGVIVRLEALGEKPHNIAPALNLSIGQRLVRRVCPNCAKQSRVTEKELAEIKKEIDNLPQMVKEKIKLPSLNASLTMKRAVGCGDCNHTGYKSRIGIFEFFQVDEEIRELIIQSPSVMQIAKKAKEKGMTTLKQDGIIKVLQGITTLEEVKSVTGQ